MYGRGRRRAARGRAMRRVRSEGGDAGACAYRTTALELEWDGGVSAPPQMQYRDDVAHGCCDAAGGAPGARGGGLMARALCLKRRGCISWSVSLVLVHCMRSRHHAQRCEAWVPGPVETDVSSTVTDIARCDASMRFPVSTAVDSDSRTCRNARSLGLPARGTQGQARVDWLTQGAAMATRRALSTLTSGTGHGGGPSAKLAWK